MSFAWRNCKECNNFESIEQYCTLCSSLFCNSCQCKHQSSRIKFKNDFDFSNEDLLINLLGKELCDDVMNIIRPHKNSSTTVQTNNNNFGNTQWKCNTCTVLNDAPEKTCYMCEFPRKAFDDPEMKLFKCQADVIEKFIDFDHSKMCMEYATKEKGLDPNHNDAVLYQLWLEAEPSDDLMELHDGFIKEEILKIYPNEFIADGNSGVSENDLNIKKVPTCFTKPDKIDVDNLWDSIFKLRSPHDFRLERAIMSEMEFEDSGQLKLLTKLISNDEMFQLITDQKNDDHIDLVMVGHSLKLSNDFNDICEYYKHECMLCCYTFPGGMMRTMLTCKHELCRSCFRENAVSVIQAQNPSSWLCSSCDDKDLVNVDRQMYYGYLRQMLEQDLSYFRLKGDRENIEIITTTLTTFENKLLDENLQSNATFSYCPYDDCDNGFMLEEVEKVACPKCKRDLCGKCTRKWDTSHQGRTCDETEFFIMENDFEKLFKDLGIECPGCNRRYALAAGGCLHFDCKCGKKFCGACYNYFYDTGTCVNENCKMSGFHAHHPRNCLYYLRDRDEKLLEKMLGNVDYARLNNPEITKCRLEITDEKKENGKVSWIEKACGNDTVCNSGYCPEHYKEYLVKQINMHKIDPADFYDSEELNLVLFQSQIPKLTIKKKESEADFCNRIRKEIREKTKFYVPKIIQRRDRIQGTGEVAN